MFTAVYRWIDRNILELGRELRLSYLPPLMVYMAAGVSGLTGIVGTFFVKDYLGLSAAFLAALGFWAGIPWALKMPLGHLVDLIWRYKSWLVFLGAGLIATSLLIMVALIGSREAMTAIMPAGAWYVLSVLLAPVGYVVQDAVADAMTVEAVPRVDEDGRPLDPARRKLMHTTMQTLGRVAIIGGSVLVAVINLYLFTGVQGLPEAEIARLYRDVYLMALVIPAISVLGVASAALIKARDRRRLRQRGFTPAQIDELTVERFERARPNWWILGGSLLFVVFTLAVGLYPQPLPGGIGLEGAGVVTAVGEGVTHVKPGDRVAYSDRPPGSYAELRNMPAKPLVSLADDNFSPTYMRNATAYGVSRRLRADIVVNNLTGHALTTGKVLLQSDGTPWRPFVHILDIAKATRCVLLSTEP